MTPWFRTACFLIAGLAELSAFAQQEGETAFPEVVLGQYREGAVEKLEYRVQLVEVKGAGVIGVILEWQNKSGNTEKLARLGTSGPVWMSPSWRRESLPKVSTAPVWSMDGWTLVTKELWVQDLPPGAAGSFFAPLATHLSTGAVRDRMAECSIIVQPLIYIFGKVPKNVDWPLRAERFKNCLLTPEGIALDAAAVYEKWKQSFGKLRDAKSAQ